MTDWSRDTQKIREWKREGFQAWQDSLPAQRRAEDLKILSDIFMQARNSPTLHAALEWAFANDIVFFIDRTTTVGGHYHAGTGVVAVSLRSTERAGTLVHEIRHAWQDAHGLLDGVLSDGARHRRFGDQFIRLSLFEADAAAHGSMTTREIYTAQEISRLERTAGIFEGVPGQQSYIKNINRSVQASKGRQRYLQENRAEIMRQYFMDWYSRGTTRQFYGTSLRDFFGAALGIKGRKSPDYKIEFAVASSSYSAAFDPRRLEDVAKMGKAFGGGNYLAGIDRDTLLKNILSPTAAEKMYEPNPKKTDRVVRNIRRQQLRIKAGRA